MKGKSVYLHDFKRNEEVEVLAPFFVGNYTFQGFHPKACDEVTECYEKHIGLIFDDKYRW